ncbi:MAG: alpha-ketoacid dehydrogenase subunit beta [Lachnospiraceae bacterium]|nr:alpha-ketoacid dehydrogenase subunit beta [Lachnospiraceae bacterium]
MIAKDPLTSLFLVDIGVWAFRDLLVGYPRRVKNIGIFEPGTISIAAGLSLSGITPIVYGISPFIVQRALEQLKLDFVYQKTGGNFITTGASYDFSTLGYSHYCPEDVMTLKTLPGFEVLTPATPGQFTCLFKACAKNGVPSYFRMTDYCNKNEVHIDFGKAKLMKQGKMGTVAVWAEMLDAVIGACSNLDVSILYFTSAVPFDYEALRSYMDKKLVLCHPFYEGTFSDDIQKLGWNSDICEIAVPKKVLRTYGTKGDKDIELSLTPEAIKNRIQNFLIQP